MRIWCAWSLLLFLGCAKPRGPVVPVGDPDVVVSLARSRTMAESVNARFGVTLNTGKREFTIPASLLLSHPDQFRIEFYTPFGTPLLTATSNGSYLHAWNQRDRVFYEGYEASQVLKRVAGGEVGIDDFLAILTAKLPLADAEILHLGRTIFEDEGVVIVMMGPDDIRVRAVIDPKTGMVRRLRVDPPSKEAGHQEPSTEPILQVVYDGQIRSGKSLLPAEMLVELPRLGWSVRLVSKKWTVLDTVPDAFGLSVPPGAKVQDLRKTLEDLATQQ